MHTFTFTHVVIPHCSAAVYYCATADVARAIDDALSDGLVAVFTKEEWEARAYLDAIVYYVCQENLATMRAYISALNGI